MVDATSLPSGMKTRSDEDDPAAPCPPTSTDTAEKPISSSPATTKSHHKLVGSALSIKTIYGHRDDKDAPWQWEGEPPTNIDKKSAENKSTSEFAIVSRVVTSKDSRKLFEVHSIIVQSPALKRVLGQHVLHDYPGVSCNLSRLTFKAPFQPFIHRWAELLKLKRSDLDDDTKGAVILLYDFFKRELGDQIKLLESYNDTESITYEHLWMIFEPGKMVVSAEFGSHSVFEIGHTRYEDHYHRGKYFSVNCQAIDWDGKRFGRRRTALELSEFHGTQSIEILSATPLRFYHDKNGLQKSLLKRGEKYELLAGHHFRK